MFAYKLAKDLGRTVAEVLEMTSYEFVGWAAFYKIEQEETEKATRRSR